MNGVGWGMLGLSAVGCAEEFTFTALPALPPSDGGSSSVVPDSSPSTRTVADGCFNPVVRGYPADGAVDVYPGSAVWFEMSEPDPLATLTVTDAHGVPLDGSAWVDGAHVNWMGEPLAPSAMYVATVQTTCGVHLAEFSTSAVGSPMHIDPTGTAFAINFAPAVWFESWRVGQAVGEAEAPATLLLTPFLDSESTLTVLTATGTAARQDPCGPTTWVDVGSWEDPTFTFTSPRLWVTLGKHSVAFTDVVTTGGFFSDGSGVQFGRWIAEVDTRDVVAALALGKRDDLLCATEHVGAPVCHACADGEPFCSSVVIDGLSATFAAIHLEERTPEDIARDPDCGSTH